MAPRKSSSSIILNIHFPPEFFAFSILSTLHIFSIHVHLGFSFRMLFSALVNAPIFELLFVIVSRNAIDIFEYAKLFPSFILLVTLISFLFLFFSLFFLFPSFSHFAAYVNFGNPLFLKFFFFPVFLSFSKQLYEIWPLGWIFHAKGIPIFLFNWFLLSSSFVLKDDEFSTDFSIILDFLDQRDYRKSQGAFRGPSVVRVKWLYL